MPDETTSTDASTTPQAQAEPAVVEPVVEAMPTINITEPIAEPVVVAIPEPAIVVEQPPVVEPAAIEESAAQPVVDLNLAPQMAPFEARDFKVATETQRAGSVVVDEPKPAQPANTLSFILGLLPKANIALQSRKRKKLDHVMDLFAKQANITNDEVEKFLHVSDATASRYLGILEKENKIKQVGAGKYISYTKV